MSSAAGTPVPPPDAEFRAFTETIARAHAGWDLPATFMALRAAPAEPGAPAKVQPGLIAGIDLATPPDLYPDIVKELTYKAVTGPRSDMLCGYLMQFEMFVVNRDLAAMTPDEQERFDADQTHRRFHERPDAIEAALTMCCDLAGRLWVGVEERRTSGHVTLYDPDSPAGGAWEGAFTEALRAAGKVTALFQAGRLADLV